MKPVLAVLAVLLTASACAEPGPTPSSTSTRIPGPAVACGDLAAATCLASVSAALTVVANADHPVSRVELGRGAWCPTPGLLFIITSCPPLGMPPPEGGQWIGHALITFAGSAQQAYINLTQQGQTLRGDLIALATPPPATPSPPVPGGTRQP